MRAHQAELAGGAGQVLKRNTGFGSFLDHREDTREGKETKSSASRNVILLRRPSMKT